MKDFLSALLWIPVMLIRWFFVALGLPAVGFSLVGDGVRRTPKMWKLWAKSEVVLPAWFDVEWWSYLYVPLVIGLAWFSYDRWHELVTIYFIFTSLAALLVAFNKTRWRYFWWYAIRNPTRGIAEMFTQPILEPRPNPDDKVYKGTMHNGALVKHKSAHRWLRVDVFSEYWYLRAVGKKKFEFRIGWKFADGTPGFTPTVQLRLGE